MLYSVFVTIVLVLSEAVFVLVRDVFFRNGSPEKVEGYCTDVIYWPSGGLTGGKDVQGVTAHSGLLPTLIDLCGLRFDDKSRFEGISLAPVLQDTNARLPKRSVAVHEQGRKEVVQTWFTTEDGAQIAAYYTYIESAITPIEATGE